MAKLQLMTFDTADAGVSETDWIARLGAGDPAALTALLELYWRPLVRYAASLLDGTDAAEDVVQEAFVRIWEKRAELRSSGTLRPYLYRMIRNLALNERRRGRIRRLFVERKQKQPATGPVTPVEALEETELRAAVERALEELPPRRREVFVLARFHSLSYQQIAAVMGISPQTVANQFSSALSALRGSLHPYLTDSLEAPNR